MILNPKKVPAIEGIDMATSAEEEFFAPTNRENGAGRKQSNFLTAENIVQPEFGLLKKESHMRMADGSTQPHPVPEDGHHSPPCRKLLPPLSEVCPED